MQAASSVSPPGPLLLRAEQHSLQAESPGRQKRHSGDKGGKGTHYHCFLAVGLSHSFIRGLREARAQPHRRQVQRALD